METKEQHVGKMETQLKQLGAKLDKFVAKAEEAGAEVKLDYRKRIEELKSKQKVAQTKLDELKAAGNEKWGTFKADLERTRKELEDALKKLTS